MGRAPERRGGAPPGMSRVGGPAAAIPPGMFFSCWQRCSYCTALRFPLFSKLGIALCGFVRRSFVWPADVFLLHGASFLFIVAAMYCFS